MNSFNDFCTTVVRVIWGLAFAALAYYAYALGLIG